MRDVQKLLVELQSRRAAAHRSVGRRGEVIFLAGYSNHDVVSVRRCVITTEWQGIG